MRELGSAQAGRESEAAPEVETAGAVDETVDDADAAGAGDGDAGTGSEDAGETRPEGVAGEAFGEEGADSSKEAPKLEIDEDESRLLVTAAMARPAAFPGAGAVAGAAAGGAGKGQAAGSGFDPTEALNELRATFEEIGEGLGEKAAKPLAKAFEGIKAQFEQYHEATQQIRGFMHQQEEMRANYAIDQWAQATGQVEAYANPEFRQRVRAAAEEILAGVSPNQKQPNLHTVMHAAELRVGHKRGGVVPGARPGKAAQNAVARANAAARTAPGFTAARSGKPAKVVSAREKLKGILNANR